MSETAAPFVAFSLGDPHGIGPEVLLKALEHLGPDPGFRSAIFGPEGYLRDLAGLFGVLVNFEVHRIVPIRGSDDPFVESSDIRWGQISREAGQLAWESLQAAVAGCRDAVESGRKAVLVTPPVNKTSLSLAGFGYPGQTDFLESCFPEHEASMAFFSDRFHVVLATVHLSLREALEVLTTELVVRRTLVFGRALSSILGRAPRIAVCGVNPHASEGGRFGDEESRVVEPAIRALQTMGWEGVSGPWPPDTVFRHAHAGRFDGVVAMFHDQGLIPLKLLAFDSAVNTTLGLPIIRTSPDHGTAFDIAGQGVADYGSMLSAIRWGLRLAGCEPRVR